MIDLCKKLVLLDRDGVLNEVRSDYVKNPEELIVFTSALRGMAALTIAGIRIGICTNQSGIERGCYDTATLAQIHRKLLDQARLFGARIERIVYCTSYRDSHPWRKPNPGMLLDQAAYFQTELSGVPFVGDNIVDIEAARAAGAEPVLVETGKGRQMAARYKEKLEGVLRYPNLEAAVKDWLE